jgi:hypothetical protein
MAEWCRMYPETRRCPITGCESLPCARLEDDDESRWALDMVTWQPINYAPCWGYGLLANAVLNATGSRCPHGEAIGHRLPAPRDVSAT